MGYNICKRNSIIIIHLFIKRNIQLLLLLCNLDAPSSSSFKTVSCQSTLAEKDDALGEDLDKFNTVQWCVDVDIMIE